MKEAHRVSIDLFSGTTLEMTLRRKEACGSC
jgi:hypothetical protein